MILTDNETKVDLLNNEAIATTIIGLLRAKPDHPVTIGVHGDWGAGKSSVLEMIEAGFADQDDVLCLKFNGWRFQGFEDAKIALIEGIVTGLIEKRPALKKAAVAIKDVFRRIDWLKVAKRSGGLALTAVAWGLRSPRSSGGGAYCISTVGTVNYNDVCFAYFAPRPAFNLKSSIVVSDSTDSDGCYTVESVPGNDGGLYVKNNGLWVRAV